MSVRAFICSESVYLGSRGRFRLGGAFLYSDDLTVFCLAFSVLLLQRLKGQPSCLLAIWGESVAFCCVPLSKGENRHRHRRGYKESFLCKVKLRSESPYLL